jgi:acetylornithine/N-succinyldiaminopimelate aminotransferase
MGLVFKQRLAELKDRHPAVIAEIRGSGLLLGLRTIVPNTDVVAAARDEKLFILTAGDNVVRLAPPLIVTEADVAEAIERLDRACTAVERDLAAGAAKAGAAG